MSGRGRGRGGSAVHGGRGRGRISVQPSQVSTGVQHSVHGVPVQSISSSSTISEMKNLSIASSSHSSPAPAAARVPVQQQPAMLQQVADAPPPPRAVPLIPSSSKKLSTPARPGFGTIGRKSVIKANHFLVDLGQKDPYQYDVSFLVSDYRGF